MVGVAACHCSACLSKEETVAKWRIPVVRGMRGVRREWQRAGYTLYVELSPLPIFYGYDDGDGWSYTHQGFQAHRVQTHNLAWSFAASLEMGG